MTKITWLGDGSDATETEWNGTVFPQGEAIDVSSDYMLDKARENKFFKVAGHKGETVEDNPVMPVQSGRNDDQVENMAFVSAERLEANAETTRLASEQHDEVVQSHARPRGRPPKAKPEAK